MIKKSILIGFEDGFSPKSFERANGIFENTIGLDWKQAKPVKNRLLLLKKFLSEDWTRKTTKVANGLDALHINSFNHLQYSKEEVWNMAYKALTPLEQEIYNVYHLPIPHTISVHEALDALSGIEGISYAEENSEYTTMADNIVTTKVSTDYYPYTMINWSSGTRKKACSGRGIKVVVMDTGVNYHHTALQSSLWKHAEMEGAYGYNFSNNTLDVFDDPQHQAGGHGTHVSGIIGTQLHTSYKHIQFSGIAPEAKIIAYKIFPRLVKSVVFDALTTAAYSEASVINNSWSPQEKAEQNDRHGSLSRAMALLHAKKIIPVFSAGNQHDKVSNYYPSSAENVITVGAVKENREKLRSSNYGKAIDIYAPGKRILSLETSLGNNHDRFNFRSGTSMASAFVTGTIALLKQQNNTLDVFDVKRILKQSASISYDSSIKKKLKILNITNALHLTTQLK